MFSQVGIGNLLSPIFDREAKAGTSALFNSGTRANTLAIVADFSGQHKAHFETYGFLVLELEKNSNWLAGQRVFRQGTIARRRMSFKAMNDVHRRRALIPFLRLVEVINGWLVLFAVPKNGESLFKQFMEQPDSKLTSLAIWKPNIQEKLLRIIHFSSFLLSGLSSPGQDVLWITDEDDIASNAEQLTRLTDLLARISSHYLSHDLGNLRCATTRSDDGTIALEDLAAIPDLGAGALCEVGTAMIAQGLYPAYHLAAPLPRNLSRKSRMLGSWLARESGTLRRLTYIIRVDNQSPGVGVTALKWHAVPGLLTLPTSFPGLFQV